MTDISGSPSPGRRLAPWLALAGLTALAALVMAPFLAPLAWAGVLAYASWPLMERLRRRCGGRDTLAASLATVLAGLTLIVRNLWATVIPAAALRAHICQNIPAFQSSQFESLLRCFPAGQLAAELDGRRPRIDCSRMKVGAGRTAP